jgi:hypothetical protein
MPNDVPIGVYLVIGGGNIYWSCGTSNPTNGGAFSSILIGTDSSLIVSTGMTFTISCYVGYPGTAVKADNYPGEIFNYSGIATVTSASNTLTICGRAYYNPGGYPVIGCYVYPMTLNYVRIA